MHLAKRDRTTYKATLSGYRIFAFDRVQTLDVQLQIEIYQASAWPCVWCARPQIVQGHADWSGNSPEVVQQLVEQSFDKRLTPWKAWHNGPFGTTAPKGPQLVQSRPKATGS